MTETASEAPRRRGRDARRTAREAKKAVSQPYITRNIPYTEILSEEGLQVIEANAETILQEIGIEFRDDPEALDMWKAAGADVQGERVRIPKCMARKLIETAPNEFIQHARNPERNVRIGGNSLVFAPVYGPPFVHDLDQGRRYGTIEDFRNFVKLAYMAPAIHHSGGTVTEPVDLPVNKRHLDMVYSHIKYSDKPFMGSVTHPERAADTVAMAEIVFGKEFVAGNAVTLSLINANSPMTFDDTMLGALKVYARAGQATIVTPFLIAGAMAPAAVGGVLAQALAEGMAGIAFTQLVNPGAPSVFGLFSSTMSMQSGAPAFGTPEPTKVLLAAAQLVRRLGVPFRSGGSLCSSKLPDAQAAYESAQSLWPGVMGGVNFMLHGAGWMEGGLASSYEKFIMDADQLAMMEVVCSGIDLSESGQAMDAVREVGPGGHYLGCAHTQANFETAFYRSSVADYESFEQWEQEGSLDAAQRANAQWKHQLASYQEPDIDPAIDEALKAFIAEKKAAVPDSNI
ncbi:MAG: trimethylamine methyltransferase family protein [Rhodospirillaceae bacterium]|jgi:trimethylamine---corrinoid protein Co-methyltransferase|nr:trimethylamine methyltransferase family protein [Rhodospirillaceae bacterium]MBT5244558.1 trimethylamine methyltransferase family protein [Rhodospirillaceae bacterium]MBT5563468.1 trimethylamine methyltransferase family protein [Rhodospirillaceae bacterium]MBT6240801.1 trimethylamine methyltransferase family protein [Rhodospirillaceae bacterium]MBT7137807.1 trimethylamine methyltransferase family protein [Rhodospirillaceae bacterium]